MAIEYEDNILNWHEGQEGKGVIDRNGFVHTWSDDEFELHRDYIDHAGLDNALGYFVIAPDGRIDAAGSEGLGVNMADIITEVDPRLYHDLDQPHDWNFSKVATETHTPPGFTAWERGDSGKGMVWDDKLWTWYDHTEDPYDDDSLHHDQAFKAIMGEDYHYQRAGHDHFPFWIDPDGIVTTNDRTGPQWDERVHEVLKPWIRAHPDLVWGGKNTWNFSRTSDNWWDSTFEFYRGKPAKEADTIEMVPIEVLEQMLEWDRRPDAPQVRVRGELVSPGADPEYYDALKGEMRSEGMKEPITVEFNVDTGYGHIGEGNHRIAIGKELGQKALPTQVYCSTRESAGRQLFLRDPQEVARDEAERSGADPNYYTEPSVGWIIPPSIAGLPTV